MIKMNEDIEKLLNKVSYEIQKHINNGYDVEMLVPLEFDVSEWTLLLSYIEQLQNNWNELKKYLLEDDWSSVNEKIILKLILDKMSEMEQGKDESKRDV